MWNEKVSLYVDDSSLRLLVTQGQKVKKWADLHLEPGLIKDSVVLQESELSILIKNLLKSQKVRTRRVVLGISGLHSLSRPATLPQLPKNMLAEAVSREARRVLPVPLDQLYLSWKLLPTPKGRIQVFIAAIPRRSIDSLMKTLKLAGLEASKVAIKPLVLTKALPVNTAILVDLQPTEYDIVILLNGIAQPIRTVRLPSEELDWDQKLKMIVSDLDRTIKFFNSNNPEKPLDLNVPLYIAGELMGKPQYQKVLADSCGHPTMALVPNMKGIEQLDPGRYLVNLSMMLKSTSAVQETTFPLANLNLLPEPYQPKPISMVKVIGIPGSVAVTSFMVPLLMTMQTTGDNIETLQNQLVMVNKIVAEKTVQQTALKKEISGLTTQSTTLKKNATALQTSLQTLRSQQDIVNGDILLTLAQLTGTINLTGIKETTTQLIISGNAATGADIQAYAAAITAYARSLDVSHRFNQSVVSSIAVVNTTSRTSPSDGLSVNPVPHQIEFTLTFSREK
jgi:type IV pilus assembly protein PilM